MRSANSSSSASRSGEYENAVQFLRNFHDRPSFRPMSSFELDVIGEETTAKEPKSRIMALSRTVAMDSLSSLVSSEQGDLLDDDEIIMESSSLSSPWGHFIDDDRAPKGSASPHSRLSRKQRSPSSFRRLSSL
mmetsp:Transcript_32102/g.73798  ORF Transcript_32102/g.73798 Transcript_32102/m.73798 type:complete len:133 (+) Transcript_32102:227-625(+)|eukprot:CAMPEP_0116834888 /NCGR_PEP_ID=MMETSP0418-20121206/7238_1 /TAXON_ID=1158023 /ORGANISM="Astrosyne radiata, Strain 13vi08-1A" /LENGTH=132 /DNA_ID=CAMNT_0004464491 /DNA_START=211 /DNA_END=609 /DNA_ORIENTATION=+